MQKINRAKNNLKGRSIFGFILSFPLWALLFSFVTYFHSSALAISGKDQVVANHDASSYFTRYHFDHSASPFSFPVDPVSGDESEAPELNELEDGFDEDHFSLLNKFFSDRIWKASLSAKKQFVQFSFSLHKRPQIPLFILFSSWKSFLI